MVDQYKLTYDFDSNEQEENLIVGRVPDSGVYIVKCDKYYKVGITQRIGSRMTGFRVNNPFPVELIFYLKVSFAGGLEKSLHKKLEKYHYKGEWFILPKTKVEEIIKVINSYGK